MTTNVLHHANNGNTGDKASNPSLYFHLGDDVKVYSYDQPMRPCDLLVVGGGMIPEHYDFGSIDAKVKVAWGVGLANHENHKALCRHFDLYGQRDDPTWEETFVPCASCHSNDMVNAAEWSRPSEDVVAIWNKALPQMDVSAFDVSWVLNNTMDIRAILAAIYRAGSVVTNSYHAAYWAVLCACPELHIVCPDELLGKMHGLVKEKKHFSYANCLSKNVSFGRRLRDELASKQIEAPKQFGCPRRQQDGVQE